jgi:predicted transcriptional regulator
LENRILNTISRRPLTIKELEGLTGLNRPELLKYIDILNSKNKILTKTVENEVFYSVSDETQPSVDR